ncbi:hypothetical protein Hypma_014858 [Hypsizygus marmoreus]|uniref:Uncharacterized protein n=1 Tax=Hypsizygus marmoreus TaxID=39966 RepID=A0A369K9K1_HYPMA|nr:hypothetical protein Hypma_014858 [Hypsizygus marmoreus]
MRLETIFSTLATSLALSLFVSASPLNTSLVPPPLPSYLGRSNIFYRAVFGAEVASAARVYPIRANPTGHSNAAGDFSFSGGLYVFRDIDEARQWGTCRARVLGQLNPAHRNWLLVEFQYTPSKKRLNTRTFTNATPAWREFVVDNYKSQGTRHDIVEGPISHGSGSGLGAYVNAAGNMVWQAAFVRRQGLATLVVRSRTQYNDRGQVGECCRNCNIMLVDPANQLVDQSAAMTEWAAFD